MKHKIIRSLHAFNKGRIPSLLNLKYKNMREDIFSFYRGTAHLFYEHMSKKGLLYNCPRAWICGDLHFENFGSFKGDNGLVYFDINDFDEALLAPCLFDIARFLVSLRLITELSGMTALQTNKLCKLFVDTYCETLRTGNSRWIEKETAKGLIKELLEKVEKKDSIAEIYSSRKNNKRALDFKNKKINKPNEEEKAIIHKLITQWNLAHKAKSIYDIMDIGYHIKGTGSLGIDRYVLLVKKKSNNKFKLVDLKMATPSCAHVAITNKQPKWTNEAERTIEVQKRVQGTYQALLKSIELGKKSYVLREYQSCEDKINYHLLEGNVKKFNPVVSTMAQVTAWGQLQSSGRQGSSITDEFIAFASQQKKWEDNLHAYSKDIVNTVKKDFAVFCSAYDEKEFKNSKD